MNSPVPSPPPPGLAPRWTPEKQRTFLEALARCGSVKAAAAHAGMSREGAYRLRRRDEGRAFARAWDAALIHARDLYAETLLDTGLKGWTETVWYHGEEVGERSRFSPGLLLAALARLDAHADRADTAGNPVREAVTGFDALVAAIGDGHDCAALLAEQDRTARARCAPGFVDGRNERRSDERRVAQPDLDAIAPSPCEIMDTSDLDPAEANRWDERQWARAERAGLLDQPGFWERTKPGGGENSGDSAPGEGRDDAAPDAPGPGDGLFSTKGV